MQRVEALRPVEGDVADVVALVVLDELQVHDFVL
jgi:hypothetical protein